MAPTSQPYTDLVRLLPDKFARARDSGELLFFESEVTSVQEGQFNFEVRICPALRNKAQATADALAKVQARKAAPTDTPSSSSDKAIAGKPKSSPFEPPYVEELFVGEVPPVEEDDEGMAVLLNKYSVLPEHFLLTSKSRQPQSLPPSPPQLLQMYNLLLAASRDRTSQRRLLAFYNGGSGAGASQDWRHAQFVDVQGGEGGVAPVERWTEGVEGPSDRAFSHPGLPYLHILHALPSARQATYPPTPASNERMLRTLAEALMRCLDELFDALRRGEAGREGGWNLLMTLDHLHLIPRSAPSFSLAPASDSSLEINALGYAGMLLVKSAEELDALRRVTGASTEGAPPADGQGKSDETQGLMRVLLQCGVPRAWGEKAEEEEGALHG